MEIGPNLAAAIGMVAIATALAIIVWAASR